MSRLLRFAFPSLLFVAAASCGWGPGNCPPPDCTYDTPVFECIRDNKCTYSNHHDRPTDTNYTELSPNSSLTIDGIEAPSDAVDILIEPGENGITPADVSVELNGQEIPLTQIPEGADFAPGGLRGDISKTPDWKTLKITSHAEAIDFVISAADVACLDAHAHDYDGVVCED